MKNRIPKTNDPMHKRRDVPDYISEGNPNNGEKIEDEQTRQEIKVAIQKEKSVSDESKNIDLNVHDGVAVLKGQVKTEQEKMTLGDKAAAFVGFGKVINELEVARKD
jgi:osmotically-inducible protein OsmY